MLKKSITFENLDGDEVTEVFYFHLSQAELVKMKLSHGGDLEAYFRKILQEQNAEAILEAFDEIILSTVGRRSPDGKRFEKDNGRIAQEFKETDAYSVLFTELLSADGRALQEFFTSVIPNKSRATMEANLKANNALGDAAGNKLAEVIEENRRLVAMTEDPVVELSNKLNKELANSLSLSIWERENRPPTRAEVLAMDPVEFARYTETRK